VVTDPGSKDGGNGDDNRSDSGPNQEPVRTVYRLKPAQQANLVGFFSLFAALVYIGAGFKWNRGILPHRSFYIYSVVIYALFWWSFIFNYVKKDSLRNFGRSLVNQITQTRSEAESFRRVFAPEGVQQPAGDTFAAMDVTRIFLLAFGVILQAAWLTIYSGGPFESPYSQILIAMALLAPCVAVRAGSIGAAYIVTAATSVAVHFVCKDSLGIKPESSWYLATTMLVLLLSGWIAFVTRRRGK
jgi:hypothetical protein